MKHKLLLLLWLISWLIFPSIIYSQVSSLPGSITLQYTYQPNEVLRSLNVKQLSLVNVSACNSSPANIIIPVEVLYQNAPLIKFVPTEIGWLIINTKQAKTKKQIILTCLKYGGEVAIGITGFGFISATPEIVAGIAGGVFVAHRVEDLIKETMPNLTELSNLVVKDGKMNVGGNGCSSTILFASKASKQELKNRRKGINVSYKVNIGNLKVEENK